MHSSNFKQSLGRVIRNRRSNLGFSQENFAERVGLHRTYVGAIERGERNLSLMNLIRIAEALNVPLSNLIADAEAQDQQK